MMIPGSCSSLEGAMYVEDGNKDWESFKLIDASILVAVEV